ncbi:electron transport complex subunit RsxG [Thalassotalea mangrovi]|uniref:Ion-translocating oxidoreductase complex subunit G n=1 Tax=Thalassotalea mangrovi TaxID=2572245 RepID=A0A4U1B255_9GAMM|nr:electron transport complex subunit RsxG [Thalassotalea mangrovi]TKB43152.1 electron transport complex subunit RsxG [Thalassotalea mangrovi]
MKQAMKSNAMILAIFALGCTLLVALVDMFTAETRARQAEQQLLNTLYQVINPSRFNNDIYMACQYVTDKDLLGSEQPQTVYTARQDNLPVAVAITSVAPDGYNGNIELLVAINKDGSLSGVRVLEHQETPGLGDKIETRKSDWVYRFENKQMTSDKDSRWAVKKDGGMFDQFTGATITPRAVVKAVKNTMMFFDKNQADILNHNQSCRGENG